MPPYRASLIVGESNSVIERKEKTLALLLNSRKIVDSCQRVKNREFLWYNSVDAFALAGTVFCRSNRKGRNPKMVCEAYQKSTENLKSYMQRQWSLVGGMAGTFGRWNERETMKMLEPSG